MNRFYFGALAAAAVAVMTGPATAAALDSAGTRLTSGPRIASGSYNGIGWLAESRVVGVTSTGGFSGGGDPLYYATAAQYSGTVAIISSYAPSPSLPQGGNFICSGSLLSDRQSILTAGHCVTDFTGAPGAYNLPIATTVYFYGGNNPDTRYNAGLHTPITGSQIFVNPQYSGEVIDQNDIAVIRLSSAAPSFAQSYDLYTQDLTGKDFNFAGYGGRSDTGGSVGVNARTGFKRQGDNRFDFRLGDAAFGGQWDDVLNEDPARIQYTYLTDFDSGQAANDATSVVVNQFFGAALGAQYANLGRGASEAGVAGGDSGGPQFIDGKIASVTSFGLTFYGLGDVDCLSPSQCALNSSFGEFNGFVPVSIHSSFINATLVPEPATYGMMALGLIAVGAMARRRKV